MLKILVVRHAIAMSAEDYEKVRGPEEDDTTRPLTEEGVSKMVRNAKGIHRLVPNINTMLSSPYTRAVQTADILVQQYLGIDYQIEPTLIPSRPSMELLNKINLMYKAHRLKTGETSYTACIIGHEPHLSIFVGYCISGKEDSMVNLRKGGASLISFPGEIVGGRGKMHWLLESVQLRRLKGV